MKMNRIHNYRLVLITGKVKSPGTKNIVIIGDSFIALELCGWLTTGLAGPDGKQEEAEKKNVSVVMLLKAPMQRKKNSSTRKLLDWRCCFLR